MEPALVSEACFHHCKAPVDPVSKTILHCPSQLFQLRSHLLNWVSRLSQAMGKLKYTLFYMGFVLKKKIDENSNVWKIQSVNVGTGVWLSLSKC